MANWDDGLTLAANYERTTFAVGSEWGDDDRSAKEILKDIEEIAESMKPMMERRMEWVRDVMVYVSGIRRCPLIANMHGSMHGAFGVTSIDLERWADRIRPKEKAKVDVSGYGGCILAHCAPIVSLDVV